MTTELRFLLDTLETPIGRFAIIADTQGRLRVAGFYDGHARMDRWLRGEMAGVAIARAANPGGLTSALERYFAGELQAIDGLPVAAEGTEFQRAVWRALREVPCGETRSYRDIARRIGNPNAVRAVGLANGKNPVGLVVPCHRIIGADGSLTGYGGGLERKRWLLAHEGGLRDNSWLALTGPE